MIISDHAQRRGQARCGLSAFHLRRQVQRGLQDPNVYRGRDGCCWIPVEGYAGRGTAIYDPETRVVVTVREVVSCTQGERADEPLTTTLQEALQ